MKVLFPKLEAVVRELCAGATHSLTLVSPWIKRDALLKLLGEHKATDLTLRVLLRGDFADFVETISDIEAVAWLKAEGAEVRIAQNLHAKVYIADDSRAILASANLTSKGLGMASGKNNLELGVAVDDIDQIAELTKVVNRWFSKARIVDDKWLGSLREKLHEAEDKKKASKELERSVEDMGKGLEGNDVSLTEDEPSNSSSGGELADLVSEWFYTEKHPELRDGFVAFLTKALSLLPPEAICKSRIGGTDITRFRIIMGNLTLVSIFVKSGEKLLYLMLDDPDVGQCINEHKERARCPGLWDVAYPLDQIDKLPAEVWESFRRAMKNAWTCKASDYKTRADTMDSTKELSFILGVNCK